MPPTGRGRLRRQWGTAGAVTAVAIGGSATQQRVYASGLGFATTTPRVSPVLRPWMQQASFRRVSLQPLLVVLVPLPFLGPSVSSARARARKKAVTVVAAVVGADAVAAAYAPQALHKELFDPKSVDDWVLPEVRTALATYQGQSMKEKDASQIDLEQLPDIRIDAPGIISFGLLKPDLCSRLLDEARHYVESGLPALAPNSMNRYGVILNDIGLRPSFMALFRRYVKGIGGRLFGDDSARATDLYGKPLGTDNWGGSTLTDHHTFVVRYQPDADRDLAMHVDECDVTFNIALTSDVYEGGDLAFCGVFGNEDYRNHHFSYRHATPGRCVVHAGKRRHGVTGVEAGERASLIMWTKSILFRMSPEYKRKCGDFVAGRRSLPEETTDPDGICLSITHDRDYLKWSHLL